MGTPLESTVKKQAPKRKQPQRASQPQKPFRLGAGAVPARRQAPPPGKAPARRAPPVPPLYSLADGVTQSMLSDFLACRQRAAFQRAGWEPKRRKTSYRFGSLVHDVLEHAYGLIRAGAKPSPAFAVALQNRITALTNANLRNAGLTDSQEEITQEGAIAQALLETYFRYWEEDWKREWVAVEGKFDKQFAPGPGVPYRLRGRRDAVFVGRPAKGPRAGQPGLWLLETKTKSQIEGETLEQTLAFDFQSLFYLLTLEAQAPAKYPIRGCLYNILRKPGLRPLKAGKNRKKAETAGEFLARIREDIESRPEHYFKRYELIFPPETRAEFSKQLGLQLREYELWLAGKLPTYQNHTACVGKYKCAFIEKCSSGSWAGYAQTRVPFAELEAPDGG